jgi:hypothetical protein
MRIWRDIACDIAAISVQNRVLEWRLAAAFGLL